MEEAILLLTCATLLGAGTWFLKAGASRREPGCWLSPGLFLLSLALILDVMSQIAGESTEGGALYSSTLFLELGASFLVFVFTRSFSHPTDFRALFWSVPMQFSVALVLGGGEALLSRGGTTWSLNPKEPASMVILATFVLYMGLMLVNMAGVYGTVRGGSRSGRVVLLTLALTLFFVGLLVRNALAAHLAWALYAGASLKFTGAGLLVASLRGVPAHEVEEAF